MNQPRVESMLASLGDSIDWPAPSPHLPARVTARIESEQPTTSRRGIWSRPAIATVAVLVVALVFVFSPSARQAVADLLGAGGVRIGTTSAPAPTTGAALNLGEPVQLDEIEEVVGFQVRVPDGGGLGPPDGVYLNDTGQLTMVWAGTPSLPAAGDTGVGLLLTQSAGDGRPEFAEKSIGPDTGMQTLMVEGQPAIWIEGASHTFTMLDPEGNPIEETTRLAANVLLWEAGGINHRLETTGGLQSSLAVADTLEPLP